MAKPFKRKIKSKNGISNQYWYIRYPLNGKEKWESIGKVGIVTKSVAQSVLEERKRQIALGQYHMIKAKIPTFKDFSSDYIKHQRDVIKKRSWKRDQLALKHLNKFYGEMKLSEITPKAIDDYKKVRINNVAPATVNRELEVARAMFNLASKWNNFFGKNPVSEAGLFKLDNQKERILSNEEEHELLSCAPPYLKSIIICALNTGMRKNEILTLKWVNVDLDNNLLIIDVINNKSKKVKRIPINSKLRKILLSLRLKSGGNKFVFLSSKGEHYSCQDSLNRAFHLALKKANIQGLRFHDLRHTAATRMIEKGVNIVAVSKILGHSDIKITMRYAHPENSLIEAVESLAN